MKQTNKTQTNKMQTEKMQTEKSGKKTRACRDCAK